MNEHTTWVLKSDRPAAVVISALVDFGPHRRAIWPETSDPRVYAVHAVGPTWAEVTEGIPFSWSRERYDWSEPGCVVLDQLDSNVALPGGRIAYTITGSSDGCTIACDRRRRFRHTPRGLLAGTIMRLIGARILRWQFDKSLRRLRAIEP
jgi:hypothetical protein